MPTHTVKAGEWIKQIALQYGFPNWEKVWDHPDNAKLADLRKEPGLLLAGDKIVIPDPEKGELSAASGKKHGFVVATSKTLLKIKVQDEQGEPLANTDWQIKLENEVFKGKSDADGLVEQEISSASGEGSLEIGTYTFPLKLGDMDPVDETTGVQKRLHNMGYDCGQIDNVLGDKMHNTLKLFQKDYELPETGELDQKTKDKLKTLHGC